MPDTHLRLSGNGRRLDRRVLRTRAALIEAFNRLVLHGRKRDISVPDIAAEAGIGRSTFYEHFGSAEALHLHALAHPFAILAEAAAGKGDEAKLARLLEHFWDNRSRARGSLDGRTGEKAGRLLAELVEERIADERLRLPTRLAARQLAAAALTPVKAWLMAEASADPAALASAICRTGNASLAALRLD